MKSNGNNSVIAGLSVISLEISLIFVILPAITEMGISLYLFIYPPVLISLGIPIYLIIAGIREKKNNR